MIDLLRCVNAHEDTWLVASFREVTNRIVMEGTLGCPVCTAEYKIRGGVVDFTCGERIADFEEDRAAASHRRGGGGARAGGDLDITQTAANIEFGGVWGYVAQEVGGVGGG